MLSIVTACTRPQNLREIKDSIDFKYVDKWYIVYDTSKCRTYDFQFANELKIIELTCDSPNSAYGNAQRNMALDLICKTEGTTEGTSAAKTEGTSAAKTEGTSGAKSEAKTETNGFIYFVDDDTIVHKNFWKLFPTLDTNKIYTWDQDRIQENRILKGGRIEMNKIDTSQFLVPKGLESRWILGKYFADFLFINSIYKKHKEKFVYIPEIACYHNYIKKVHVAICFFGLTRSLKLTMPSIQKYLFDPLFNHGIKYDTYLHTYKMKEPYSNPRAGEKNIILDANEYKLLEPNFHMVEDKFVVSNYLGLEKYRKKGNPWDENSEKTNDYTTLDNHILYLWSQKQLTDMVKKNGRYTHMIFCRPDVLYQTPLDISWFSSNKVLFPNFGIYSGINDRFAIGQSEQMMVYGSRFLHALAYSKKNPLASEKFLFDTLKKNKIETEQIDFQFVRVRANAEKSGLDITQIRSLNKTRRKRKNSKA